MEITFIMSVSFQDLDEGNEGVTTKPITSCCIQKCKWSITDISLIERQTY